MALNKYVEAAKDSYKPNRTGNKYVDAAVSGSSIAGRRKTVRSEAAASYAQKQQEQQRKKQASNRMTKLNRQTTRRRIDTGEGESRIGTGWENRADLDKLWGQELSTKAYQDSVDNAAAKLDNSTPDTTDMNNATRYEQMQEARRRANNKSSIDAGKQEAFETAKWEETQRIGIQGTKDPQLLQNLQQLNSLYTTANMGHESVAGAAKEQYDTLYNRLKDQYGDRVDDWAEYVKRLQNAQSMREMTQRIANAADESPVVASLATPIVNVASGAGIVDVGAQRLGQLISGSDTPIDYNRAAQLPSNWVTTTRGTVSDKIAKNTDGWIGSDTPIGNLWSGAYNLGMSMADSVVGQKLGGATMFMGGAAATNAMNEARQRGASTDQALGMGLLAGAAETVMEKIPMDRLLSQTNPTSVRSAIKNILRQSASEATEEGLTTLANTISDAIIMGDKSELSTAIRAYRASGYSDSEAQKKAFTNWLIGLAGDTIGGAVSGGLFAAGYNVPGGIAYKRSGGDANSQNNASSNADHANPNAEANVEQNSNTDMDPLEFAVRETMKPSKEQQAMDQALQETADWMLGKEQRNAATAETTASTEVANQQTIEQNQDTIPENDMGAKKSDFEHEVKQSKSKTTPDFYEKHNVPDGSRTTNEYTAVTEAESLHNAKMRLEQDYDGEMVELRSKPVWTNEEVDMGQMILEDLWYESTEIGDDSAFRDWDKVVKQHKQEIPRALQAMAKWNRNSGAGIVSTAIDILDGENTRNKVDTNAVMHTISDAAKQFDAARMSKDVDGLVQLIKDTAGERNTAYRKRKDETQKQSKYLNWALNRIAGYAKAGTLTGNVDPNLQINASNIQNPDVAFRFLQDFASTGILNIAADTQKVSMGTKLMALRRSGMLSKLSTAMRNLVSNSGFNVVDTIARDISVPLDMLLSNFTKTRSVAMDYGYLSKAARQGSLDNIAMASLETSLDVNGRGNSGKYASGGMRTFKANGNIVERFLSNLEALQGYEMYVTDEMSKGRTQAGVQEGINDLYDRGKIKASDDSLRDAGHQEADYRTFQNDSALANATLKTRDALNTFRVGDVGAGDALMPFAQVPANLADRAIDYSPAGLAKTTGKMVDAISKAKSGEFTAADQAAVVQSLGRNITGTVMIGIAAALAANGLIRVVNPGGEDENKDKAALEKMQGQNGTQWNLSATKRKLEGGNPTWQYGDELISIAFMEPMNAQLTIGALLAEDMEQEGQLTTETALKDSFAGSLAAILDLPMMDTIGDAIDAYNYSSEDRTGDKLLDAGSTLAANEVASLIPNWMKGVRQGLDPYQRDMYSKDDVWGQVADQYQAVFGDRNELPIKQDSFGRDMTNEGGVRNFLNANVLPGYVTTYKGNELTDEITRLAEETGSSAIFPSRKAPDELTIDGEKLPLSYEERQQYQKVYGNMDEAIRTGLMASDVYSKLSSEERYKAHQFSEDFAKQTASSAVNKDYDADNWVEELQGKSEAEIVEAVLYKTFSSLAEGKQYSSKYDGMDDLMDQGKLSDAMAITMMPAKMQTVYQDVAKKGGVSVNEWLDMYAYAYPAGKTDKGTQDKDKVREAALEYIGKQGWSESKKVAAANAVYQFLPNTAVIDVSVPGSWALDYGDSGLALVESYMGKTQTENYEKYIKGHLDNDKMKLYLDAYAFKGTAKSDKNEKGDVIYSAKNKVIDYIDSLDLTNREKIRVFLGLDYAESSIPYWWMY